jgi:hypothetical protein
MTPKNKTKTGIMRGAISPYEDAIPSLNKIKRKRQGVEK